MNDLFNALWAEQDVPMLTQEKHELYAAFCLMRGYESFLEVGSCYGTSLYILAHALKAGALVHSIDLCEDKSAKFLYRVIAGLNNKGYRARVTQGSSHELVVVGAEQYDVVFIDADHKYEAVKADVEKYRPLCKHLFMMHDIRMDGPGRVFDEIGGGLRINCDHKASDAPDTGFGIQWM